MRVNDDLAVLKLPMEFGGNVMEMNLSLILDSENGATLVDTGLPNQELLLLEAIKAEGVGRGELKRVVLTHQDMDHVGSLHALKSITGIPALALDIEVPYIDGRLVSPKRPSPERLAQNPELKAVIDSLKRAPVDQELKDGQRLDLAGGVRVIATPGHTFGHMSLYLERTKTLITGDALTSNDGTLHGPMEMATPDMDSAKKSVRKLAELDVETILCYHGGLVTDDANGQLRRVAAELVS